MQLQVGSLVLQEEKDPECFVPRAVMGRPQWEDRGEESVGFWNMWGGLENGGLRASAGRLR